MGLLLFIAWAALVAFTFVDALWTTQGPEGDAGPLTSRLSTLLRRSIKALVGPDQHYDGGRSSVCS